MFAHPTIYSVYRKESPFIAKQLVSSTPPKLSPQRCRVGMTGPKFGKSAYLPIPNDNHLSGSHGNCHKQANIQSIILSLQIRMMDLEAASNDLNKESRKIAFLEATDVNNVEDKLSKMCRNIRLQMDPE